MAAIDNGLVDHSREIHLRTITNEYLNFLDDSASSKVYAQKIEALIKDDDVRLIVNLNDVRQRMNAERAEGLISNFVDEIVCFQEALKDTITKVDADYARNREFYVGFEGAFGDRHVNPRTLKASFLGNMVCCEGIVTKCSSVRPKVVRSVHYCPATGKTLERKYTDLTSYDAFPTSTVYPTEDENKNPLETEFGLSTYKNHQTFTIQELPESAPAGQLPRSVDIIADDDLADRCNPGDRVRIIGLYRCLPNKQQGFSSGTFRSVVIANNIQLVSKDDTPSFGGQDISNIRKMSKRKDVVDILARSLAPSICGNEEVKKAILCLLLGGCERILENGSRLRGDVNVLLIGDPSVAKSQLLRYVLHTAPRAVTTTGRGSSGVGLTAAVTTDNESGERRLEAGAMVLADRGIVCIDEFDKMSDIDRTAIHEVMEQGRVTVAKAGIHAKLNARCSVLAAANPVSGRYDLYKTPMENISMQDSLLSRFDLIFVLLDEHEPIRDQNVANHVLKLHQYRTPGEADGTVLPMGAAVETMSTFDLHEEEASATTEVYEKDKGWTANEGNQKILSMEFVRKYIHMAKEVKPQLTEEASHFISECYSELRSFDTTKSDRDRTMPITARQLETMIRLSTAMARARMSKKIERVDAEKAYQLLHFACFKEKPKERMELEQRRRKKKDGTEAERSDEEMEVEEDEEVQTQTTSSSRATKRRRGGEDDEDTQEPTTSSMDTDGTDQPTVKRQKTTAPAISVDRYKKFKKHIRTASDRLGQDMVNLEQVRDIVQEEAGTQSFTDDEFAAGIDRLQADNIIMVSDDNSIVFI
ncbi:hypothetical protein QR680_017145 [Steinernema hermaphroditum]|uniref:DNA replication licensing factor MCM3 n=1 Tax=Steinernema hermaphroditum TaxID=289476 RepID=A0AA39HE00_9BILA|nr:hypothetical protein QR680_017145 [Steinernema hermaphroditum]